MRSLDPDALDGVFDVGPPTDRSATVSLERTHRSSLPAPVAGVAAVAPPRGLGLRFAGAIALVVGGLLALPWVLPAPDGAGGVGAVREELAAASPSGGAVDAGEGAQAGADDAMAWDRSAVDAGSAAGDPGARAAMGAVGAGPAGADPGVRAALGAGPVAVDPGVRAAVGSGLAAADLGVRAATGAGPAGADPGARAAIGAVGAGPAGADPGARAAMGAVGAGPAGADPGARAAIGAVGGRSTNSAAPGGPTGLDGAAPSSLRAWEVSFAFDSATPDAAPDPAAWRSCAGRVEVTGHADPTGPAAYNLRLALRRAEAVRDALIAGGVAAARVEVRSAGERQPAVAGDSIAARRASRRVVIRCVP